MVDPTTGKYDSLIHIGPGNIRSNSRELVDLKTVKDENLISGKFHFDKGDIIYGKINPQLAKYTIAPAEGLSSADTYVLKPKSGIERLFLYYTLGTNRFFKYTVSVSQRTGMPKINRDELNAYSLIIAPSLFEQKRIGLFLRKTDDLIAATQHRIDTLEHVKKALLQHVLDQSWRFKGFTDHWKRHKISDIFRVTRGKVLPTSSVANQKSLATPFPVYSSQTKHDGLLGYYHDYLYADAITWTTDGANAGMVKYRPQKFYSTNVNRVLISSQGYANTAVASILNTIAWKYVSHVGNPKLMGKVMADISLELPSIPEQKALSSLLENLNNTIRTTNVKLSKIQLLKSSLLQQLFI
ncbi:restriction endonuclease subunit S [Lacticaseibacillus paracasei]|uniref:restriction endonuclease subunit S n=1 Tax=Lacticaseibacillus paracasei TaxID=1597 RepID=UPI0031D2E8DB